MSESAGVVNTGRRNYLLITLALSLLAVMCGVVILLNMEQAYKLNANLHKIGDLSKRLSGTRDEISQMNAVFNRALGTVVPVRMPDDWEARLAILEGKIAIPSQWPQDPDTALAFTEDVDTLISQLPVWAEADYVPRLNPVRWTAMVFANLHPIDLIDPMGDTDVDSLGVLVNSAPVGVPDNLLSHVQSRHFELAKQMEREQVEDAFKRVKLFVSRPDDALPPTTEDPVNYEWDYQLLALYENDAEFGEESSRLRNQLRTRIVLDSAHRQAISIVDRFTKIDDLLRGSDPQLYSMAVNSLLGEARIARLTLAADGLQSPPLDEIQHKLDHLSRVLHAEVMRNEEARNAKAIREYQRWTIQSITSFESAFRVSEKQANTNASLWKADNGGWDDALFIEVRDAMVKYVLPINPGLLDTPVLERYQQVFQLGMRQLDGRDEQTYVIEQTVTTVKKSLSGFIEEALP